MAQMQPPSVMEAMTMRMRPSPLESTPRLEVITEAVKVPSIAIVIERITKLGSWAIMGGA